MGPQLVLQLSTAWQSWIFAASERKVIEDADRCELQASGSGAILRLTSLLGDRRTHQPRHIVVALRQTDRQTADTYLDWCGRNIVSAAAVTGEMKCVTVVLNGGRPWGVRLHATTETSSHTDNSSQTDQHHHQQQQQQRVTVAKVKLHYHPLNCCYHYRNKLCLVHLNWYDTIQYEKRV